MSSAAADPRLWTAETVGTPATWTHPLPDTLVAALTAIVQKRDRADAPITELRLSGDEHAALGGDLADARRELNQGRGFVVLDRLPMGASSPRTAVAVYWLMGQLLGEPVVQNVQGTLLYDVRDGGQDVAQGARFSVTNYESSFHTDNSFGETVVDYVGLLCLATAQSGGMSQVVSGLAVVSVLRREAPEALDTLRQAFHVDRRGGFREGEAPTVLRPVIELGESGPLFRYLRYWIEAGHTRAGEPLDPERRGALDRLDAVLNRLELRAEFALEPGQVYFLNNRWILHNRTAFQDHPEPSRRRHLVRLWLEASAGSGRPMSHSVLVP